MVRARSLLLCLALAFAAASSSPRSAEASISIAVRFDALVADADLVAEAEPTEHRSVWENGRIYTYTRLTIREAVAGTAERDVWVRTMGGVVDKIGQLVEGEPVFTEGTPTLVFLHKLRDVQQPTWVVSARAQGQYAILRDVDPKAPVLERSSRVGTLVAPRVAQAEAQKSVKAATAPKVAPATGPLAQDLLHGRKLADAKRDIQARFRELHAR